MEYYDRTLFEITAELEGYNRRWEEKWRHTQRLYTLIYNKDLPRNKQKKDYQLMPLPSQMDKYLLEKQIEEELGMSELQKIVKG